MTQGVRRRGRWWDGREEEKGEEVARVRVVVREGGEEEQGNQRAEHLREEDN